MKTKIITPLLFAMIFLVFSGTVQRASAESSFMEIVELTMFLIEREGR